MVVHQATTPSQCFAMKVTKLYFPVFIIFLFFFQPSYAQKLLENTHLYLGFSWQDQDRRLFDFPYADVVIGIEDDPATDFETNLYFQKRLLKWWHFGLSTGIGYMRYQTKFSRPFRHTYFTGTNHKDLRHIGIYVTHKLAIPTSLEFYFDKEERFFLNLTGWASFNFNKRAIGSDDIKFGNRVKFEFNSLELNPGLGFKAKRMSFQFNYRALHFYKIDRVIFNDILFITRNPPFLDKKYESLNLDKFWITVGYDLTK